MAESSELVECPSIAHEMENEFNPRSQDAYGPGYFNCTLCNNTGELTIEQFNKWEQEALIDKLNGVLNEHLDRNEVWYNTDDGWYM